MVSKLAVHLTYIANKLLLVSLCFLIVFLPSVHWQGLANATESSKLIFFYYALLTALTLILISYLFFTQKKLRIKVIAADLFLFFLIIYIFLNRFFFQSYAGFSQKFYQFTGLIVLYVILRTYHFRDYIFFLLSVLFSSFLQATDGMLQLTGILTSNSIFAITGNFVNSGSYAGFLAVSGVLAVGTYLFYDQILQVISKTPQTLIFDNKKVFRNCIHYISLLCLISVLIILPALRSRAAWFAFAMGAGLFSIIKYNWFKVASSRMATIRLFVLPVLVFLFVAGLTGIYRYKKDSADGRLLIYKVTSDIVKCHPFVGVGFDRFKAEYMNAQANWFFAKGFTTDSSLADNTYYAFNEPLQFTVENGVLGLLLISLTTLIFLSTKTDDRYHILRQLCIGVFSTIFVFGFFTYLSDNLPITMLLIIVLALLANIASSRSFSGRCNVIIQYRRSIVFKATLIALLSGLIWTGVQFTEGIKRDYKNWSAGVEAYNREDYKESLNLFRNVNYVLYDDGDFLMQYGKAAAMAGKYREAIGILNRAKLQLNNTVIEIALGDSFKALGRYKEAEHAYQQATNMVPGKFYPHYLLAKLYEATGDNTKALWKAREILSKKIKIPSTAITEMRNEMRVLAAKNERGLSLNTTTNKVTN